MRIADLTLWFIANKGSTVPIPLRQDISQLGVAAYLIAIDEPLDDNLAATLVELGWLTPNCGPSGFALTEAGMKQLEK